MKIIAGALLLFLAISSSAFQIYKNENEASPTLIHSAHGQKNLRSGRTYALIVGVSNYQEKNLKLNFADKDAEAFADLLKSNSLGHVDSLVLLTNESATKANIGKYLSWLLDVADSGDKVFFFFSGHGDNESRTVLGGNYLLAYDATSKLYDFSGALEIGVLKKYLETLSSKNVKTFLIADACKSGTLAGALIGQKLTAEALQNIGRNSISILSCAPGELSYEDTTWGSGHGVFSYYLIQGLAGMATQNTGVNSIFGKDLLTYLDYNVRRETNSSQNPYISANADTMLLSHSNLSYLNSIKKVNNKDDNLHLFASRSGSNIFGEKLNSKYMKILEMFNRALNRKQLIGNSDSTASSLYEKIMKWKNEDDVKKTVSRDFAAVLQNRAQQIINKYINGQVQIGNDHQFLESAKYLEEVLKILDNKHPLYNSIKARYLFLAARSTNRFNDTQDEFKKAMKMLQASLQIDSTHAYTWNAIGLYAIKLGDSRRALGSFKKALSFAPEWVFPMDNIAAVYYDKKNYDSAFVYSIKSIQLDPDYSRALKRLSQIFKYRKEFDSSKVYYKKALLKK